MWAGFEGGMVFGAALVVAYHAIEAMLRRTAVEDIGLGLVLMGMAMVVNGAMGVYLIRSGKKHKSLTLEADGKHLFADAVTSAATIVALAIVKLSNGRLWIVDPIIAIAIAIYITYMAVGLMRSGAAGLLDQQDKD